jgi:hypothetical protein
MPRRVWTVAGDSRIVPLRQGVKLSAVPGPHGTLANICPTCERSWISSEGKPRLRPKPVERLQPSKPCS